MSHLGFESATFKSGIDNALEASLEVNNINLVQANKKATADARVPVLPKTRKPRTKKTTNEDQGL